MRTFILLILVVVILLQSCSPYSVNKPTIYTQYPGQPSGVATTVIAFTLIVDKETIVSPTITLEGKTQTCTIKEVYSSTNQILSLEKPLRQGSYRIIAHTESVINDNESICFELTLNSKQYTYCAQRAADIRMK